MVDKHQRSNDKPKRDKDGQDRGRLRRIANDELENIGHFFQDAPSVT